MESSVECFSLSFLTTSRILFHFFFSNSYAIISPTVAPAARPIGPPITSPTVPVHPRLPNHAPDATSTA
jgi:hypothetical protein